MVLLAIFSTLGACAHEQGEVLSLQPRRDLDASDYASVLGAWTREEEIYDKLDSILFVSSTFYSPEFRRAFLLRHPDVYGPGSEEASRLLLTSPDAEVFHEFFFSAATSDMRWNDFDKKASIWRVTLQSGDSERVDGEVKRVKTTANLQVIFPYITPFSRTYRVRFPLSTVAGDALITGRTERITLRFTSALGEAELVWRLSPASH